MNVGSTVDYIARYIGPIMSVPPQKTLWMYTDFVRFVRFLKKRSLTN